MIKLCWVGPRGNLKPIAPLTAANHDAVDLFSAIFTKYYILFYCSPSIVHNAFRSHFSLMPLNRSVPLTPDFVLCFLHDRLYQFRPYFQTLCVARPWSRCRRSGAAAGWLALTVDTRHRWPPPGLAPPPVGSSEMGAGTPSAPAPGYVSVFRSRPPPSTTPALPVSRPYLKAHWRRA